MEHLTVLKSFSEKKDGESGMIFMDPAKPCQSHLCIDLI